MRIRTLERYRRSAVKLRNDGALQVTATMIARDAHVLPQTVQRAARKHAWHKDYLGCISTDEASYRSYRATLETLRERGTIMTYKNIARERGARIEAVYSYINAHPELRIEFVILDRVAGKRERVRRAAQCIRDSRRALTRKLLAHELRVSYKSLVAYLGIHTDLSHELGLSFYPHKGKQRAQHMKQ